MKVRVNLNLNSLVVYTGKKKSIYIILYIYIIRKNKAINSKGIENAFVYLCSTCSKCTPNFYNVP